MSKVRLIDANALREKVCGWFHRDSQEADSQDDLAASLAMEIDAQPTIDAAPVVRCRDCAYCAMHHRYPLCKLREEYTEPDDFCSSGKKRMDAARAALEKEATHGSATP